MGVGTAEEFGSENGEARSKDWQKIDSRKNSLIPQEGQLEGTPVDDLSTQAVRKKTKEVTNNDIGVFSVFF